MQAILIFLLNKILPDLSAAFTYAADKSALRF
jgi:hypothetical protein